MLRSKRIDTHIDRILVSINT